MTQRTVLDASAFDVLDTVKGRRVRALLERTAVEGARSAALRSRSPRSAGTSHPSGRGGARPGPGRPAHPGPATDERLAKLVGAILYETGSGSERLGDAHVVAVCAGADAALVLTSDPGDIATLAVAVPGTRVVIRDPAVQSG